MIGASGIWYAGTKPSNFGSSTWRPVVRRRTRVALYDLIAGLARNGLTVVVSSSDVGDLLAMCTRIVVLRNGHVAAELEAEGLTEHALVRAMEGEERVRDAV